MPETSIEATNPYEARLLQLGAGNNIHEDCRVAKKSKVVKREGIRYPNNSVKTWRSEVRPCRWQARIWLGSFDSEEACMKAYDAALFYTGKPPVHFIYPANYFPPLPDRYPDAYDKESLLNFVKKLGRESKRKHSEFRSSVQQLVERASKFTIPLIEKGSQGTLQNTAPIVSDVTGTCAFETHGVSSSEPVPKTGIDFEETGEQDESVLFVTRQPHDWLLEVADCPLFKINVAPHELVSSAYELPSLSNSETFSAMSLKKVQSENCSVSKDKSPEQEISSLHSSSTTYAWGTGEEGGLSLSTADFALVESSVSSGAAFGSPSNSLNAQSTEQQGSVRHEKQLKRYHDKGTRVLGVDLPFNLGQESHLMSELEFIFSPHDCLMHLDEIWDGALENIMNS